MGRQAVLLQELLAGRRLQGRKAEDTLFVLANGEVDRTVAEVANAIEQYDRVIAHGYKSIDPKKKTLFG